jgi:hypothetical protein
VLVRAARMNCTRYRNLVQPLLDPELDGGQARGERAAMHAHELWCGDCAERLQETRLLFMHLHTMARVTAPPGFAAAVLERVQARAARRRLLCHVGLGFLGLLGLAGLGQVATWVWTDTSAAWVFAALGRMATWWYSWLHDVVASVRRAVDLSLALPALFRAGRLVLAACIAELLVGWLMMTAAGVALHAWVRGSRPSIPRA